MRLRYIVSLFMTTARLLCVETNSYLLCVSNLLSCVFSLSNLLDSPPIEKCNA